MNRKKSLERLFYDKIPKARKINPFFREQFELIYDASLAASPGRTILNIYSSNDLSGDRENVFSSNFFTDCQYHSIDFWEDQFIGSSINTALSKSKPEKYHTNYPDNSFDVVITTKVIMEHVSSPEMLLKEVYRILKPGGRAFVIAPHIRRQHQPPYDYYRFTEYALSNLFKSSGFSDLDIRHCGGFMAVVGYYFYFFQRGLGLSPTLEKSLDFIHYYVIEPLFYGLDRLDNGYGRDMTLYFMVRAHKSN
jgi:SAM-dependent methyltransferase